MKSELFALTAAIAVFAGASAANATTLFGMDSSPGGTALKLSNEKSGITDTGSVGAIAVNVAVTGPSNFASGDATIKPAGDLKLTDLIFTPASDTAFDGFSFRGLDLAGSAAHPQILDVIVTDQNGVSENVTFSETKPGDFGRIGIIAEMAGETIKSVEIQNSGGFKQAKQFQFEPIMTTGVPEPATWAMMLVGFGGLGVALRRARRDRAPAAA